MVILTHATGYGEDSRDGGAIGSCRSSLALYRLNTAEAFCELLDFSVAQPDLCISRHGLCADPVLENLAMRRVKAMQRRPAERWASFSFILRSRGK
jgi:hypothetical protein